MHRRGRSARARRTPRRGTPCATAPWRSARSARSHDRGDGLAAGAAVRPHQPVRHRLADLRGGQCPRSRRSPIRRAAGDTSSTVRPASSAVTSARWRGLLITSGSSQLQVGERLGGQRGLFAAVVGELEIGAAGVLAAACDHSVSPCRSRSRRCRSTLTLAILPHAGPSSRACARTRAWMRQRDASTGGRQSKGWGRQDDDGGVVGCGDGGEGSSGCCSSTSTRRDV